MSANFFKKIGKLIIHPKRYFIDYFHKKLKIENINNQLKTINTKLSDINRMINLLTVYTDHKGLQRGDLFVYANQDKIFPDDFIRAFRDKFYRYVGYFPDLKNPKTFYEKINWLKFYYYNPNEKICGDKSTVKKYIADRVGSEHVLPLLGVYEDVSDIDFDALPEQVVFKNTASGMGSGVRILRNKSQENLDKLKFELNSIQFDWIKTDFLGTFNPKKRDIKMRLIAEPYIEEIAGKVYDYKFFCFHGKARFIQVEIKTKEQGLCITLYDLNFRKTPFQRKGVRPIPDISPPP